MSAETLRRAAALMRERAEAATEGPWSHGHEGLQGGEVVRTADVRVARIYKNTWPTYLPDCENAEHIASWHPAVALAVAAVIDHMAEVQAADEADGTFGDEDCECPWCQGLPLILHLARAYLGESS